MALGSGGFLDSVMFLILVTLILTVGLSLAMIAYEGQDLIRVWFNLCDLEVGKAYAEHGFSYYCHLEMKPGEYVDEQKYMARVFDNLGKEPNIPNCTKYNSGYYKEFYWAKPGEVQLVTHPNMPKDAYPNLLVVNVNNDYPTPPYDAPSLAYLSTYPKSISIKDTEAALVYLTGLFPVQKIDTGNMVFGKSDIYLTYPTQNYVVVKFMPGDHIGEAKMERVGVIMFGRLPAPVTWAETIGVASPLSLGVTNPLGYLLSYVNGKIAKQLLGSPNVVGWAGYEGKWQKLND